MSKNKTINIIGGSIAGCCAALAILNNSANYNVRIFERAPQRLRAQGAGIAIPIDLYEHLKKNNYLDADFPGTKIEERHFVVTEGFDKESVRTIWRQPLTAMALHWNELFKNLRNRISDDIYFSNQEVVNIDCSKVDRCLITLKNGEVLRSDLTICADGHASISRRFIYPDAQPEFANYIAWRGLLPFSKIENSDLFKESVPLHVNSSGHLLFYPIIENGKKLLNWVFFEKCDEHRARQLLVDKTGHSHQSSLFPGLVSDYSKQLLYNYASQVLSKKIAEIIFLTEEPFLQRVYHLFMPNCRINRLVSLGDAASILAPNAASGATKALQHAINLGCLLKDCDSDDVLDRTLDNWNQQQVDASKILYRLSNAMAEGLILNPPNWQTITPSLMEEWWKTIIQNDKWYATQTIIQS